MIHLVIGTKAQLVKMAPVMVELRRRNIDYNFIFTGQHHETMGSLRENFSLPDPDITLHNGKDITSIPKMFFWLIKILWRTFFDRKSIFLGDRKGIVLVHGDTFSTLLGALMGKMARLKVGHVESGLRSFNYLHPFPEELTRVLTFYLADVYFCPGKKALQNLKKFNGDKVNTEFNTLIDSLYAAKENFKNIDIDIPKKPYCIVTIHRFENIFNKPVLEQNLKYVIETAKNIKTLFILHPITDKRLKLYALMEELENNPNIECRPRYDYFSFMKLVYNSEFLITDGGSNQEECWFMGKPCLLLRKVTERPEGLNENVVISEYSESKILQFINNYDEYKSKPLLGVKSPSAVIVNSISSFI